MKITFEKENETTIVGYEKNEDGFAISYTTKRADRESISIDKYDNSWREDTVHFFFVSKVNAVAKNSGKIVNIEL